MSMIPIPQETFRSAMKAEQRIEETKRRKMSITPLEPRTAGGLRGFGFTVSFEDVPASYTMPNRPFE